MFFAEIFTRIFFHILVLCGYISQGPAFPPALSAAEEREYLKKFKNGDMNARSVLIEHNMRLVAHIAKKYGSENSIDDLISIGSIGLIKGIDSYDFTKNNRLSSYISRCIENEVLMTLRANKKRQGDVSIDESVGTDKDGNALTYSDIIPADASDIADTVWTKMESRKLDSVLKRALTPDEMEIISSRYGLSGKKVLTQKEIAKKLGISRSYVSRIEKRCLKKLYDEYNK